MDNSTPAPLACYDVYAMILYKNRIVLVRFVGSSLVVTIPALLARACDLARGDEVLFQMFKTGLSITKLGHGDKRLANRPD